MTKKSFGVLPSGEETFLYTISCGKMTAQITDFGAALMRLYVPDAKGELADVVLGFDDCNICRNSTTYAGATVGRNANRICDARFTMNGKTYELDANQLGNQLHSGKDTLAFRLWQVDKWEASSITFRIFSPDGDQGFPGNADIRVTYELKAPGTLTITYDAICNKDTVFNFTNHSFFNLAGHDKPKKALQQELIIPARYYTVIDSRSIPTGEMRSVEGTPMDFRLGKPIGQDLAWGVADGYFKKGYDHNFEVFTEPCAILRDPDSGRTLSITTDCPGILIYSGNYVNEPVAKDGMVYRDFSGIAMETQFYPDAVNRPEWAQPFTKANTPYHSQTKYVFST